MVASCVTSLVSECVFDVPKVPSPRCCVLCRGNSKDGFSTAYGWDTSLAFAPSWVLLARTKTPLNFEASDHWRNFVVLSQTRQRHHVERHILPIPRRVVAK